MPDFTLDSADRLRRSIGDIVRAIQHVEDAPAGQLETLGFLMRDGGQTIAQLARLRRVRHQSMSGTVAELESQRLVARASDPADGRSVRIELTDAGAAVIRESRLSRSTRIVTAAERTMNADELAALARVANLFDKLRDELLAQ